MKHTKEPWEVQKTHKTVLAPNGRGRYMDVDTRTEIIRVHEIDYARAAECVNALKGIENPAEWVKKAKEALKLQNKE